MTRFAVAAILGGMTALAGMTSLGSAQPPAKLNPETAELVKGNNAFALDLYSRLSKEKGNLFFSPYSISTALAMTYGGARGQTANEMAKTLHFPLDQDNLHRVYGDLMGGINGKNGPRNYELAVANRLWGQKGYIFDPNFLKGTQDNYGAGLKEVDFVNATEQARQTINAWVEEQTKQKIKELLKPGVLQNDVRFVLTNAIYFKAAWAEPFNAKVTKPGEFKTSTTKSLAGVPMMGKLFSRIKYHDGDSFKAVALPYAKNELAMVVLLPKEVDGLAALEKTITATPGYLSDVLGKMKSSSVRVTLPKFKVTSEFELSKQLGALGMKTAFTLGKADFSGIATREPLAISKVVHKAFVDVNEAGTEAAAATAVSGIGGGKAQEPPEFRADHPFLFLIVDNASGSILFIGRLADPKG